ncbi:MAG: MFS transporter [Planctomycetota bacterium]
MDATDGSTSRSTTARYSIRSVAFWAFLLTQFLGAFNDNYFKQMVLLTCLSQVKNAGEKAPDRQPIAMIAFAVPFILLSGFGGFLSDRISKQRVIAGCKVAEIFIMATAVAILLIPDLSSDAQLLSLIGVLALMGSHSAIFAPSKYGVLPELFYEEQLRPVNGAVQMTTFLAIIFGTACAGFALDKIGGSMWIGSVIAIGIACLGTVSSLVIPRTRPADPGLKLHPENLFVPRSVVSLVRQNPNLMMAIVISSVFWFLGGVTQMGVNTLGKSSMGLSDTRTSLMVAGIGFGIAAGCIIAGFLGSGRSGRLWVTTGAWLLFFSLTLIAWIGSGHFGLPRTAGQLDEPLLQSLLSADRIEWSLRFSMVLLGVSAGMFFVPIQVYLQQAPPADLKGRLLGVQNLMTWIGIVLSALYVSLFGMIVAPWTRPGAEGSLQWLLFVSLAAMMIPICLFYRLPEPPAANIAVSTT